MGERKAAGEEGRLETSVSRQVLTSSLEVLLSREVVVVSP